MRTRAAAIQPPFDTCVNSDFFSEKSPKNFLCKPVVISFKH
jgi:hypothetical protein